MIATRTLSCWRRGPPLWPVWPSLLVKCVPSFNWRGRLPRLRETTPRRTALLQGLAADQLAAHVPDALADGHDGEHGQDVDGDLEHVADVAEDEARGQDHDADGAVGDADLA